MRSRVVLMTCLALVVAAGAAFAAGTVETRTFHSPALDLDKTVQVYLPEGYPAPGVEYPVLIFLSESFDPTPLWAGLDDMIGAGWIRPMVMVEICGACTPFSACGFPGSMTSWWKDSELNGAWRDALVSDLVGWLDNESGYAVSAARESRYLLGLFTGGGSAMMAALEEPETFGAVVAADGNGTLGVYRPLLAQMLASEYPEGPPYDFQPSRGLLSFQNFMIAAAFTPNVESDPWPIDFWVDSDGEVIEEVWQRMVDQTSPALVPEFAASGFSSRIYFDCDANNLPGMMGVCAVLDDAMIRAGVAHVSKSYQGQTYADRVGTYLSFLHPLGATAESPSLVFNPRRWWPIQDFALELPLAGLGAASIDPETVAITAVDDVELASPLRPVGVFDLSDVNGNGAQDLTVRFWVEALAQAMRDAGVEAPAEVTVTLRGETFDELYWEATEALQVPNLDEPPRHRQDRSQPID